jgi:HPt (histidine-containing phosphotransfer) domain-containing protein
MRLAELGFADDPQDRAVLRDLLRAFVARAPQELDDLAEALRRRDGAAVESLAHGLRGTSATLGGDRLAALLEPVEARAGAADPTLDVGAVDAPRRELAVLSRALEAVAAELEEGAPLVVRGR